MAPIATLERRMVLDTAAVAFALSLSPRQVRNLAKKRALPRVDFDRRMRFWVEDVRAFIARSRR